MRVRLNAVVVVMVVMAALPLFVHDGAWAQGAGPAGGGKSLLDLSLEDLTRIEIPTVTGAAKHEQTALQAPSSVTVVTADEIRRYGYTTLADVMRGVRGFYVTNNRNYSFVGTRGFSRPGDFNSRVLVMLDGHRINDNVYGQGSVGGEMPLDVDLIDRVEIIRGPGSALYGTGAFFGVVNIIPKRGADIKGVETAVSVGSNHTRQGRVTVGKQFDNGLDAMASLTGYGTHGQKSLFFPDFAGNPAFNNGHAINADAERWNNAYGSLKFEGFTLAFAAVGRKKAVPTGLYGATFGDAGNTTWDQHAHLDLQYQRDLGNGSDLHLRLYTDRYRYFADGNFDVPPLVLNKDYGTANWWGAEARYSARIGRAHRVTLGAEYVNNTASDQRNFDVNPFMSYNDAPYRYATAALYAQDEYAVTDQLTLTLGLRMDRQYDGIQSVNPRLAAVYMPQPGTAIKALYGTAFRAANSYERFTQSPFLLPNPALKPEEIKTTEFVVEHSFRSNLRGIFSLYRYQLDKLVTQVPVGALEQYQNAARINARGFDVELQAKFKAAEGRVSYSQQHAKDTGSGLTLSNAPKHLVKLNMLAPIDGTRLSAAWETQYTSHRTNWANQHVAGYSVSNVTLLGRNWVKGLDLTAGIHNLFDKRYADPASNDDVAGLVSIPQDRRSFRLRAVYQF